MPHLRHPRIAQQILAGTFAVLAASPLLAEPAHHHHRMARDADAFHSVLAPIWHAGPGPERLKEACAKADEMGRKASEIRSTDASRLSASIAALQASCQGRPGDVDGALYDVHEQFHHLIDARPGSAKRPGNNG